MRGVHNLQHFCENIHHSAWNAHFPNVYAQPYHSFWILIFRISCFLCTNPPRLVGKKTNKRKTAKKQQDRTHLAASSPSLGGAIFFLVSWVLVSRIFEGLAKQKKKLHNIPKHDEDTIMFRYPHVADLIKMTTLIIYIAQK